MDRRHGIYLIFFGAACVCAASAGFPIHGAQAAQLGWVSDIISDSRPLFPADHSMVFQIANSIPSSGSIGVVFEGNPFVFNSSLGYQDADFAVSTSSPVSGFVDRPLAAVPAPGADGFSVSQAGGSMTITLASALGAIPSGAYVRLRVGKNAIFGGAGTYQITNPATTTSYRILINTAGATSTLIDYGATMIAIIQPVAVTMDTNKLNPAVLTNGLPSGTIPANISGVLLSLNTDTFATCRYATTSGVLYDAMTNTFDHTALGTLHTANFFGITQGNTYNFYVRCVDFAGNKNTVDYVISFSAGSPTGLGGGTAGGGTVGGGGGGGGGGGPGAPYPSGPSSPSLLLRGVGLPNSQIIILKDGVQVPPGATTDGAGIFSANVPLTDQGTYSFTLYIPDGGGQKVSAYVTTLTVVAGTQSNLQGIVMPPSIALASDTVPLGGKVSISGLSEPSSTIKIRVMGQSNLQSPFDAVAYADGAGKWTYSLDTAGFPADTYYVKGQSFVSGLQASPFSYIAYLGVGKAPVKKGLVGDLNGDGKVNLVDFSILLFHWGQSYPAADLNMDGKVNLIDFSIMLFNWTG